MEKSDLKAFKACLDLQALWVTKDQLESPAEMAPQVPKATLDLGETQEKMACLAQLVPLVHQEQQVIVELLVQLELEASKECLVNLENQVIQEKMGLQDCQVSQA